MDSWPLNDSFNQLVSLGFKWCCSNINAWHFLMEIRSLNLRKSTKKRKRELDALIIHDVLNMRWHFLDWTADESLIHVVFAPHFRVVGVLSYSLQVYLRSWIRQVLDKFKATFLDCSHVHCGRVGWSLFFLVEELSFCQFPTRSLLDLCFHTNSIDLLCPIAIRIRLFPLHCFTLLFLFTVKNRGNKRTR